MVCNLQTGQDAKEDPRKESGERLRSLSAEGLLGQKPVGMCSVIPSELEHFLLEGEGYWNSGRVTRPLPRVR